MDPPLTIDWSSDESHLLLNPRMPEEEQAQLRSLVVALPGHVWIATSGSTGALKLTALSKQAMLASAEAVNRRFDVRSSDVWACVLPEFHVGGLGIHARAFLAGATVVRMPWESRLFAQYERMTLASLVPAQVSDLVQLQVAPPPALRAVIVGGGVLPRELYEAARALGWPVLPSYGMTETCSQVATAMDTSPELVLLDHVETRMEEDGRLAFRGPSLLTGYATRDGFVDPKTADGWFITEDIGMVAGNILHVQGRRGDFLKIGGESVDLARLDAILERVAGAHAALIAVPDERLGHVLHLVADATVAAEEIARLYGERVHPFERARAIHQIDEIPRSPLGKLLRRELWNRIHPDPVVHGPAAGSSSLKNEP